MHAAEFSDDFLQQIFNAGVFGDVAGLRERPATKRFNFSRGGFYEISPPAGRNDIGSGFGQCFGDGKSNAAGAADDDCSLVGEIEKRMAHKVIDKVRENYTVRRARVTLKPARFSRVFKAIKNFAGVGNKLDSFGLAILPVFQVDGSVVEIAEIQLAALRLGN